MELLRISRVLCVIVGGVFVAAALSKAWEPDRLADSIGFLTGIPESGRALAVAVVMGEAVLGLSLVFFGATDRRVVWCGVAALTGLSVVVVRLATLPGAPRCGCFGVLENLGLGGGPWWASLVRNVGLIAMLGLALDRSERRSAFAGREHGASGSAARAFTLTEVLVSIAAICVLVSLLAFGLRGTRERAKDQESFSGLRQAMAAIGAYSGDYREAWPYLQTPGDFHAKIVVGGVSTGWSYFAAGRTLWPNVLYPGYLDAPALLAVRSLESMQAQNEADRWNNDTIRSRFDMTEVAFARPEWFSDDDPPRGFGLLKGTRVSDVASPARKGVLVDSARFGGPAGAAAPAMFVNASRADGSAAVVARTNADPLTVVPRWRFGVVWLSISSTRHGWRGVDFGM